MKKVTATAGTADFKEIESGIEALFPVGLERFCDEVIEVGVLQLTDLIEVVLDFRGGTGNHGFDGLEVVVGQDFHLRFKIGIRQAGFEVFDQGFRVSALAGLYGLEEGEEVC